MTIDQIRAFRDEWANAKEPFDKSVLDENTRVRAWTGEDSEGYRVLTKLIKTLEAGER